MARAVHILLAGGCLRLFPMRIACNPIHGQLCGQPEAVPPQQKRSTGAARHGNAHLATCLPARRSPARLITRSPPPLQLETCGGGWAHVATRRMDSPASSVGRQSLGEVGWLLAVCFHACSSSPSPLPAGQVFYFTNVRCATDWICVRTWVTDGACTC